MSTSDDSSILFPWGLDKSDHLVNIHESESGRPYKCPGCEGTLFPYKGPKRQHHFHHESGVGSCSSESQIHAAAKLTILKVFRAVSEGGSQPVLSFRCSRCTRDRPGAFDFTRITDSEMERKISTGHIGDVVAYSSGSVALVVEVRKSHAVPSDKAKKLGCAGIPWVELQAEDIMNNAMDWECVSGNLVDATIPCPCESIKRPPKPIARSIPSPSSPSVARRERRFGFWVICGSSEYWEPDYDDGRRQDHYESIGYHKVGAKEGDALLLWPVGSIGSVKGVQPVFNVVRDKVSSAAEDP